MNRQQIETIAKVCHQANKAYCQSLGDESQQDWDYADQAIRDSAFNGVLHILLNPDCTPADLHESWSKEKVSNGWVYGEEKDAHAKTHPCLVPYSDLPEAQRKKDALFGAIARALLGKEWSQ